MKIGQFLGRSSEWAGNHVRFGDEEPSSVRCLGPSSSSSLSPSPSSSSSRSPSGENQREEVPKPFPPHPSWEVVWSEEHKHYYFWHPRSHVSRWAIVADSAPILTDKTIKDCEVIALTAPIEKRASVFRKALYETADYQTRFGKTRIGSRAINWKEGKVHTGEFLCPSLKKAFTAYQKLGKQDWYKTGKKGGRVIAEDQVRCVGITAKGIRCSKKKRDGECLCTQHLNIMHRVLIFT
jgi:hypothetical protein